MTCISAQILNKLLNITYLTDKVSNPVFDSPTPATHEEIPLASSVENEIDNLEKQLDSDISRVLGQEEEEEDEDTMIPDHNADKRPSSQLEQVPAEVHNVLFEIHLMK